MTQLPPRSGGPLRGRGTSANPAGRFERLSYSLDETEPVPGEENLTPAPETQLLKDTTRSILSRNDSPDIPFTYSVNPYRGCEHACVYCYARPSHEYLGFSAGLDFETRILVKKSAPDLLRKALASPKWTPQVVALSGNTDPYQPVERKLRITRGCLEVFRDFRNPVGVISKNALVARDLDLLRELAEANAVSVNLSVTTLDEHLAGVLEPRASRPHRRLAAIEALRKAGVPVGVMVAPVIPGLTDHEIPAIVQAAADAGAESAGTILLRLPHGLWDLFEGWLEAHYPDRKNKVLHRVLHTRGGRKNDPRFGSRHRGEGFFAGEIQALFRMAVKKAGLAERDRSRLSTAHFRRPGPAQLSLFRGP